MVGGPAKIILLPLPLALVCPHHYSVAAGIKPVLPLPLLLTLLLQQQQQQQHKHTVNCYEVETSWRTNAIILISLPLARIRTRPHTAFLLAC
jgi:hypothetical protein